MNIKTKMLVFVGYALIVAVQGIGILVAYQSLVNYKFLADGILGLLVWSFAYHLYLSPKRQIPPNERISVREVLFIFPTNIKLLIFGFFWTISLFWASWEIMNAILYLIRQARLSLGV